MTTVARRVGRTPAYSTRGVVAPTIALLALCTFARGSAQASLKDGVRAPVPRAAERILSNDNRTPAGTLRDGTLTLHLVAREGRWFPQADSGPSIVVQAFAEEGGAPRIPGPLVRVPAGTMVRLSVRNTLDSALVLFGMHERPGTLHDSVTILPGATAEVSFSVGVPGSYFYWGSTTGKRMEERGGVDSQLYGAFIMDSTGGAAPRDRIFVLGAWNEPPDTTKPKPWIPRDMMVINGKSWPHTERFDFAVGDTVHWRWLNPTMDAHPMHLHGFYFGVESRGSWAADSVYAPGDRRLAVTEMMLPGGTMTLNWIAERAGNWLFHCHFGFHVSHYLSLNEVPDAKDPDSPAEVSHSAAGMAGLILGIAVRDRAAAAARPASLSAARSHAVPRDIRLFMQAISIAAPPDSERTLHRYSFVEQRGETAPSPDSVPERSAPLVLRRGDPVRITVVNRMPYPSAVHWHGIEVQDSYMDGVPGWSGSAGRLAPVVLPADSFVVEFTPLRAGTFIYHSHSNEYHQIQAGLAAPLIVLEPWEPYDTLTDRTFLVNQGLDGSGRINGIATPDTVTLIAGTRYRFRVINIAPDWRVQVTLADTAGPVRWRAMAKDGADLPPLQSTERVARITLGAGETADFAYTPEVPGALVLDVTTAVQGWSIRVPVRVTEPTAIRR